MFGSKTATVRRDQCCLCGKTKEQVRKLIVGLSGAVCSDCINLCNDILGKDATEMAISLAQGEGGWDGTVRLEPGLTRVYGSEMETLTLLRAIAPLIQANAAMNATEASEPAEEPRS